MISVAVAHPLIDLDVYLRAARDVFLGADPYVTAPGELPYLYPPAATLLFWPLAWLPAPWASLLWTVASVAALTRTLHLVLARVERPVPLWVVLSAALLVEPVQSTLHHGQINLVVMWLVLEGFLGRDRRLGVLIGLAVGLKLTPALFVFPLLMRRDWPRIGAMGAGFAASVVIGWVVAPGASVRYWSGLFADAHRVGVGFFTNQSYAGALERLAPDGHLRWLLVVLSIATVLLLVVALRASRDPLHHMLATSFATLLISPLSWSHHWVWVVPWGVAVMCRRRPTRGWRALLAGWAMIAGLPLLWLLPRDPWWGQHLLGNAYLLWGAATLVGLAVGRVSEEFTATDGLVGLASYPR